MPHKVNLNQAPLLREKLMFAVIMLGVFIVFLRFFYNPQAEVNKKANTEIIKVRPNYEAFVKMEKAPRSVVNTTVVKKPKIVDEDFYQKKVFEKFSTPPRFKESLVTDLNQKLVSRDLLKNNQLNDIKLGEETLKDDFTEISFSVNLTGGYLPVIEYIDRVSKLPMLISFKSFSIASSEDKTGRLSLSLNGILYIPVPGQRVKSHEVEKNKEKG